ncbi:hypothetical protein ACTXT7_014064 [Hymenolepis weldensis]
MIYAVQVGKDTWVRHHNQLRRRLAERTIDKRYRSICQIMVLSRTARTRMKHSRLRVDPLLKTYRNAAQAIVRSSKRFSVHPVAVNAID